MDTFIACEGVVKIYKVAELEVFALQGLDLHVERGEMLGLIGASGSGKSTLLQILGGLDRASAGKVMVNGRDLFKMTPSQMTAYRRGQVGFVWQQGARNMVPYLSARQNVELPMSLLGRSGRAARRRAEELLDSVGLSHRRDYHMGALSGGEQQRAAIAIALANAPPLLLADEPTGELDSESAAKVYATFKGIRERYGVTVLIVSHDRDIGRQVDRVVGIQDGKVSTEVLSSQPDAVLRAVLDSAGRVQLPKALREEHGFGSRAVIESVEGGLFIRPSE